MKFWLALAAVLVFAFTVAAHAQSNELAAEASGLVNTSATNPSFGGGFQVNYAHRIVGVPGIALYGEVPFVAGFNNTGVNLTQLQRVNFNSFYLTPGLRVKFIPGFPISPYFAAGVGWGHFSGKNTNTSDDRFVSDWGGGLDIKVAPIVGLRLEARDFYSGVPSLIPIVGSFGNQHNVVVSAGVVLRF
jgi:outer membrane protein with beta-barrel domain